MDTTRLAAQRFTQSLFVELRSEQGASIPVPTDLSYGSSDPYAVTVTFGIPDAPLPWTFARDLLSQGLLEPTGDGDVHVWPCLNDEGVAVVAVELCSPYGSALLEIATLDVVKFVDRTHAIVAPGAESDHLDMDATIAAIRTAENA